MDYVDLSSARAWCDEVCKWRNGQSTWDMLQFALRIGDTPQAVVTTTPRPLQLLKDVMADATTVVTRASTVDNAENLAPSFVNEMQRRYAGTVLGRQELGGEVIRTFRVGCGGAIGLTINECEVPDLKCIVVAVDPPVTATINSDACGIVVPESVRMGALTSSAIEHCRAGNQTWARAVRSAYGDHRADRVVAEVNQGGDLVVAVLKQIDPVMPVRTVRATQRQMAASRTRRGALRGGAGCSFRPV